MEDNRVCASCGEILIGKYCHKCGDKKFNKNEFTVSNFLGQVFYAFTHFESKIWISLNVLCMKPGKITFEYLQGKRIKYMKPVQLFLLINIFYFFMLNYIGYDVFTSSPEDYMSKDFFKSIYTSMINEKVKSENFSLTEYSEKFYNRIYVQSKLLIVLLIPFMAMFLKMLYFKSNRLYFEHLIYSTHYLTFLLFFVTVFLNIISYLLYFVLKYIFKAESEFVYQNEFGIIVTALTAFVYASLSMKVVYGQSGMITILKTLLFMLSFFVITEIYRTLLFFTVYFFA